MTTRKLKERLVLCRACEYQRGCVGLQGVALPATVCPLPGEARKWAAVPLMESVAEGQFGDVVQRVVAPGVWAVDQVLGTNLKECGGCEERRVKMNVGGVDGSGDSV